ncbi:MAG: VCBS repeat-containing protein [Hormoscilla sp. GUM202]|nr:VCBS repeat-containing protein [Hormoscilla sp. GUM202]
MKINLASSSLNPSTVGKGFPLKRGSTLLYAGDFNNDDKSDILRQERGRWDNDSSLTAQVVLSEGDGNFNPITLPEKFVLKGDFTNLYIGDFNGDDRDDILRQEKGGWDNDDSLTAQVLLSQGDGNFTRIFLPEGLKLKGDLTNLYIGDFDGDGQSDVLRQERGIWGNDDRTTAQILLSQGDGNFNPITLPEDFALKGDFTNVYIGDFNGDGRDDVLRQEKGSWDDDDRMTAHVLLSRGDGNFTRITLPESFELKGDFTNLYVGDFNGDGADDVLRQEKGSWDDNDMGTAHVLKSQGNGNFTRIPLPESFELKGDLTNLYVEDLNGDGLDEILVQKKHPFGDRSRTLRLLRSDNGENFTEHLLPSELQVNGDGGKLYIADYDGNGKNNDILVQSFANEALLYNVDFQPVLNPVLNTDDYAALKALYTSTSGENWQNNFGWEFGSDIPPLRSVVSNWYGVTVKGDRVTAINLPSNSLSGTLPSELGSLGKLQQLDLDGNSLSGTIPSELDSLSNLQILSLENPPYVETQIPDYEAVPGEDFSVNVSAHFGDINDNITSYSAEGLPNGLTINSDSGAIGGTLTVTEGTFTVTVTASDDAGGEVEDEFNIEVRPLLDASDYAALLALYNSTGGESWQTHTGWDVTSETPPPADVVSNWHGVTVRGDRVTAIELNENDLSGMLPSELGSLSNLQEIDLRNNSLSGTLPYELVSLSNLQKLDLSRNYSLSGTLPYEYGSLSNLQEIDL